jgi:putative cardiolipin synthase
VLALPLGAVADDVVILNDPASILRSKMDIIEHPEGELMCSDFLFRDDQYSLMKLAGLIDARKRGVRSRNLVDALHLLADPAYIKVAQDLGVEFGVYNPANAKLSPVYRFHDKGTATHGRYQTGGTNTGGEYVGLSEEYVGPSKEQLNHHDRDALITGGSWKEFKFYFDEMWQSRLVKPVQIEIAPDPIVAQQRAQKERSIKRRITFYAAKKFSADLDAPPDPKRNAGVIYITQTEYEDAKTKIDQARVQWNLLKRERGWLERPQWKDLFHGANAEFIHDPVGLKGKSPGTETHILNLINGAKKSVLISTPYLILTEKMKNAIAQAVQRGVNVEILTNSLESSDNKMTQKRYEIEFGKLASLGVQIREKTGSTTLHAKTYVADETNVLFTGYNLDPRSEKYNTETGVLIEDSPQVAKSAAAMIRDDFKGSVLVAEKGRSLKNGTIRLPCIERTFLSLIRGYL